MNSTMLSQIAERLGWTLLHSLWQFTVVAMLLALAIRFLHRGSAQARYIAGCVSLALMVIFVPLTFATVEPTNRIGLAEDLNADAAISQDFVEEADAATCEILDESPEEFGIAEMSGSEVREGSFEALGTTGPADLAPSVSANASASAARDSTVAVNWQHSVRALVDPWVVHLAIAWLIGILVLSLRPVCGWYCVRRLRRFGNSAVSPQICEMAIQLSERIGLRRAVSVVESTLIDVPTVIGELRPLVLLPASAITGLSRDQLEAVIAHELAHVCRHDYLVNWLQTIAETVFFYHPALWWVSHQMRIEREDCCDDIAMEVTGDRAGYAKMLVMLETLRGGTRRTSLVASHAMSSGGGSLVSRIRRIIRQPAPSHGTGCHGTGCHGTGCHGTGCHGTGSLVIGSLLLVAATITVTSLLLPARSNVVAQDPFGAQSTGSTETVPNIPDPPTVPLELRILANPPKADREPSVREEDLVRYRRRLERGELDNTDADEPFRWFPVADAPVTELPGTGKKSGFPIQVEWQGRQYVLACNDQPHVIAWDDINQHIEGAEVLRGEGDAPQVDIKFDHVLRHKVSKLTSQNFQNQFAILVDGKIVSALRIQSVIHKRALITGRFTDKEAERLKPLLQAVPSDNDSDPANDAKNSGAGHPLGTLRGWLVFDGPIPKQERIPVYRNPLTSKLESVEVCAIPQSRHLCLTAKQQRTFNELRGPMPAAMRKELSELDAIANAPSSLHPSVTMLGPLRSDTTPVALNPPSDIEIIHAWKISRKENGQEPPSATEILNLRRVLEKTTDYADPPRFYPLVGMARLHHAMYKCAIYTTDNRVEVVYIDRMHLHRVGSVDSNLSEAEFSQQRVSLRGDGAIDENGSALMRYRVRNVGNTSLENVRVVAQLEAALRPTHMTSSGSADEDQVSWEFDLLEPGAERVFEIRANVEGETDGLHTVLVQANGNSLLLGQFSLQKPELKNPTEEPLGR